LHPGSDLVRECLVAIDDVPGPEGEHGFALGPPNAQIIGTLGIIDVRCQVTRAVSEHFHKGLLLLW